jgi:hypothetical protein
LEDSRLQADQLLARGPLKQKKEQWAQSSTLLDQGAEAFLASGSHDQHKGARNATSLLFLAPRGREGLLATIILSSFCVQVGCPRQSMHTLLISHTFSFSLHNSLMVVFLTGPRGQNDLFFLLL